MRVMKDLLWKNLYGYLRKEKIMRTILSGDLHFEGENVEIEKRTEKPDTEDFLQELKRAQQRQIFTYSKLATSFMPEEFGMKKINSQEFHHRPPTESINTLAKSVYLALVSQGKDTIDIQGKKKEISGASFSVKSEPKRKTLQGCLEGMQKVLLSLLP